MKLDLSSLRKAESVYEAAVSFLEDARYLLDKLQEHND